MWKTRHTFGVVLGILLVAYGASGQVFGRWNKNAEQKRVVPAGPVLLAFTDPGSECSGAPIPGLTFTRAGTQPCANGSMTTTMMAAHQPAIEPDGLSFDTGVSATVANPYRVDAPKAFSAIVDIRSGSTGAATLFSYGGFSTSPNSASFSVILATRQIRYQERAADGVAVVSWLTAAGAMPYGPVRIAVVVPPGSGNPVLTLNGNVIAFPKFIGLDATRVSAFSDIRIGAYSNGAEAFAGRMRDLCITTDETHCPTGVPSEYANGIGYAFVGDSLTAGPGNLWPNSSITYPRRVQYLQGYASHAAINFGQGSYTAAQVLTRWTNEVRARGHPVVVLLAGVNDIRVGTSAASTWPSLKQIVDEAKADGRTVVVSTVWPFSQSWTAAKQAELDALNTLIRDYAASESLILVDGYALMGNPSAPTTLLPAYNSGDGLHVNEAGNIVFAQAVYDALNPPAPLAATTPDESSSGALAGILLLAAAGATAAGVRYARRNTA